MKKRTDASREALREFARRPWKEVEGLKLRYWRDADLDPSQLIRMGDELRRHGISRRADSPGEDDRRADVNAHARVARLLRSAHDADVADVLAELTALFKASGTPSYVFGAQAGTFQLQGLN